MSKKYTFTIKRDDEDNVDFHAFDWDYIKRVIDTKGDLAVQMGVHDLSIDYALPQQWLNEFVEKMNLDYEQVRSTTVSLYIRGELFIISGCKEVQVMLLKDDMMCNTKISLKEVAKQGITDIFEEVEKLGIKYSNHCSDLYIPVNLKTKKLIQDYKWKCNVTTFFSQIPEEKGMLYYDIPFAYPKYHTGK